MGIIQKEIINKMKRYAALAVRLGVNVRRGDKLLIWYSAKISHFVRLAAAEAYSAGAADVVICAAGKALSGEKQRWEAEDYKMLWVYAPPETEAQERAQNAAMPALSWTLACAPTPAWAKKVFPHAANDAKAMQLMWQAIFDACRIGEGDPLDAWRQHIDSLQSKADALTACNFKLLRLKNGLGTNLEIELPPNHVWLVCGRKDGQGQYYISNIPTEEVFCTPIRTSVSGVVYASKPMACAGGDLIEGFWLRFRCGKVTEYGAKTNQSLLKKLLETAENADYLGEVALVPHSSPISRSGIFWHETSFDENASCHLALGQGFAASLKGAGCKSAAQLNEMGVNLSPIHQDFMIGTADTDIKGVTHEGKEMPIFLQGEWAV